MHIPSGFVGNSIPEYQLVEGAVSLRFLSPNYERAADLDSAFDSGRPEVNPLDGADSDFMITSGGIFQSEKGHLQKLEYKITSAIDEIQDSSGYTGQYEVNRYGYAEGNLAIAKHRSGTDYKRLAELNKRKPKPYVYRADLTRGAETKTFYLGLSFSHYNGEIFENFSCNLFPEGV